MYVLVSANRVFSNSLFSCIYFAFKRHYKTVQAFKQFLVVFVLFLVFVQLTDRFTPEFKSKNYRISMLSLELV